MTTEETLAGLREMATYDCGFEEQSDIALAAADVIVTLLVEVTALRAKLDAAVEDIEHSCQTCIGCETCTKHEECYTYGTPKAWRWRGAAEVLAKECEGEK